MPSTSSCASENSTHGKIRAIFLIRIVSGEILSLYFTYLLSICVHLLSEYLLSNYRVPSDVLGTEGTWLNRAWFLSLKDHSDCFGKQASTAVVMIRMSKLSFVQTHYVSGAVHK